jgi:hypothetical protein
LLLVTFGYIYQAPSESSPGVNTNKVIVYIYAVSI